MRGTSNSNESSYYRWIPDCAKAFVELREHWAQLLPESRSYPLKQTSAFFSSIEALMSIQLRSIVEASIHQLTEFIEEYKVCCITLLHVTDFYLTELLQQILNFRLSGPKHLLYADVSENVKFLSRLAIVYCPHINTDLARRTFNPLRPV